MYSIIAAAILIAFVSGFVPQADIPEKEMNLASQTCPLLRFREEITPREAYIFKNITAQEHDYSCGSAALATLLNYGLGENLSEKQVIRGMLKHGNKEQITKLRAFSLLDMKTLCKVLGYDGAAGYRAEIEDVKNSDYWPCIVPIKLFQYRHFVVLKGVHDGHVFLADPFRGNISYSIRQFEAAWYENVIFLVPPKEEKSQPNLLRLTKDDLVYISAETTWDIIKNKGKHFEYPVRFQRDDIQGEYQFYK